MLEANLEVAKRSSPSRGTWIEIVRFTSRHDFQQVVPLTGDVD